MTGVPLGRDARFLTNHPQNPVWSIATEDGNIEFD
jgi:hypothetical protein